MNWVSRFLQRTSELCVARWKSVSSLEQIQSCDFQFVKHLHIQQCDIQVCFSASLFERFKGLQELQIFSCSKMETVFLLNNCDPHNNVFPRLKRMNVHNAPRLTALWRGVAPSVCFQSLQHVTIESCAQMKSLFPLVVAEALNQLQYLEVSNCESLEAVISNGVHEIEEDTLSGQTSGTLHTHTLFPRLQTLKLMYLENLISLRQPWYHLDFPSLERVTVLSCPCLKKLPFGPKSFQALCIVISSPTMAFDSK